VQKAHKNKYREKKKEDKSSNGVELNLFSSFKKNYL
jgi:hypothetical protein